MAATAARVAPFPAAEKKVTNRALIAQSAPTQSAAKWSAHARQGALRRARSHVTISAAGRSVGPRRVTTFSAIASPLKCREFCALRFYRLIASPTLDARSRYRANRFDFETS